MPDWMPPPATKSGAGVVAEDVEEHVVEPGRVAREGGEPVEHLLAQLVGLHRPTAIQPPQCSRRSLWGDLVERASLIGGTIRASQKPPLITCSTSNISSE